MNKIILATGSDLNYLPKMSTYLKSIEKNSNFDKNILVFLNNSKINLPYKKINIVNVYPESVKQPSPINCLQHGDFLNSPEWDEIAEDNDIICFTDGDMNLQRNLTEKEINMIRLFYDGDVFVGYNASPDDTLLNEYHRLSPRCALSNDFKYIDKIKVYNTGVLMMNKKTWKILLNEYIEKYPEIDPVFGHYAKQQWLISYIINTNNYFNVIEMGYHLHNHTHYKSPKGSVMDNSGIVRFNNDIVLFKHKWF